MLDDGPTERKTESSYDSANPDSDNIDDDDDSQGSRITLPGCVSGRHSVASTRIFDSTDDILAEFQSNKVFFL